MKRLFAIMRMAAFVVPALAAADPQASRGAKPRYSLTIRAERPEYKVGSKVWIDIATKNVSNSDIESTKIGESYSRTDLYYIVEARDSKGNIAPETELGKRIRDGEALWAGSTSDALNEPPAVLRPGATKSDKLLLNRLFDLSHPGKCMIEVRRSDDKSATPIKSNVLTITLVN